jgi:class 3 adenylate cyclase/predicted ATPase
MPQIADWLEKLGMSEYTECFAQNDIDFTILSELADQDLEKIGVASLGHRRKLLRAIANLEGVLDNASPTSKAAGRTATPKNIAERRQVTVMFSDLVGSTALSARMDPEDLREVISAYQKCVVETVDRFGGFVAKYMGDGVLVYFGYPQAHEDDADRAVRAGLELVAAVSAIKTSVLLQTRVGIATGLVVVGDLIGSGEAQERGIIGDTPNLSARLQGFAEPNMVVIAEGTRRLLGNLFELQDLGAKDLKGIARPVRAWAALRPTSVESRFEALHASGLTDLVGREEELELLLRRWSKAKTGEGQAVLLSGEAGIGKSRLTAALLERLAAEPHTPLRYFCSPQHTDSTLYPIISQMERAASFTPDDTTQSKLDKLDALLARSFTPRQDVALLADMLSLPNDGRFPKLDLPSEQRRQKTLQALTARLEALSRSNPTMMIFEDVHWIDPTSLEILSRTADRIRTLSVLLIVTYRPEFEPPWVGRTHVTALTLNRLGGREIEAIMDRVTGNRSLRARVRQDIIDRTDGIPLFVEEMTKAVLEAESEGDAQRTAAAHPSPALAVPASLHASLMARLDRLGPAKEIAQVGAAIGREFSYVLLAAVLQTPKAEVASGLSRLVSAGLLFQQGVSPHTTYLFKHALVQDAAYGTLLREPRRALHARIAEMLESRFPEIAENQPELLARHYTEAGLIAKSFGLWSKAGQRSLARSAFVEAAEQLTRALDQIASLPATPALRREQIQLQVAIITPLMYVKGYVAPETQSAAERARLLIERAEELGETPEDPLLLFSVLYGFWTASHVDFNGKKMRDLAGQFLRLAEKQGSIAPIMVGHRLMGMSLLQSGDIAQGRAHFDRAIALYDPPEHRALASRFGVDSGVSIYSNRSWALWILGDPAMALADAERALQDARQIGQAAELIYTVVHVAFPLIFCGNYVAADELLENVVTLAGEKRADYLKALGMMFQGCLYAVTGKIPESICVISSGIAAARATGSTLWVPLFLSSLAMAYAKIAQFNDAWRCFDEATAMVEKTDERWCESEVNRIAGEIALMPASPDAPTAEMYFERALAVARQQQAKSWELRAAISMARLWRDQGKPQHARELLAPVYGGFTGGFETLDLKEAMALLDELHA